MMKKLLIASLLLGGCQQVNRGEKEAHDKFVLASDSIIQYMHNRLELYDKIMAVQDTAAYYTSMATEKLFTDSCLIYIELSRAYLDKAKPYRDSHRIIDEKINKLRLCIDAYPAN